MRVVLFGMPGIGTLPTLRAFLSAGIDVRALVMPGVPGLVTLPPLSAQRPVVPIARLNGETESIEDVARHAGIPVLLAGKLRRADVTAAIAAHQPDLIVASCYPFRLPPALLQLPRLGCLNAHPSLLPRWRGAEPVFWALRNGDTEIGLTIHYMNEEYDAGPIVLQESVEIPSGIRLPDFERDLATGLGLLLVQAIDLIARDEAVPRVQDDSKATDAPIPVDDDYLLPTSRSAEWAYRFARAVAPLNGPLAVLDLATNKRIPIRDAIDVNAADMMTESVVFIEDSVLVRFIDGVVRFAW